MAESASAALTHAPRSPGSGGGQPDAGAETEIAAIADRPAGEDRSGDGDQARLEFLVGDGVAALANRGQLGVQRRSAGDRALRCAPRTARPASSAAPKASSTLPSAEQCSGTASPTQLVPPIMYRLFTWAIC